MLRNGASARRPSSVGFISGPDMARAAEVEFVACCHCQRQHAVRSSIEALAAGREVLGYCARCNGVHCPECTECVPAERQLENLEAGRLALDTSRVSVAIPRAIEG